MSDLTKEQFENWFGGDHINNVDDLTNLIMELINNKYSTKELKTDIVIHEGEIRWVILNAYYAITIAYPLLLNQEWEISIMK